MWLAMVVQGALACEPYSNVVGFDDWVDGAVDVPTDARIVTLPDLAFDVTLTRLDTGEVTATVADAHALDTVADLWRVTHTPAAELAPSTEYRADVVDHYGVLHSATFTTGAGATAGGGFAGPILTNMAYTAWEESDAFECLLGDPILARTVSGVLNVLDGLPVGSYVALRSDSELSTWELVAPGEDYGFDLLQAASEGHVDAQIAARDCLTAVLILPSGAEVPGETSCTVDAKGIEGCGCAMGGGAGAWGLVAVAALGLAGRRRR